METKVEPLFAVMDKVRILIGGIMWSYGKVSDRWIKLHEAENGLTIYDCRPEKRNMELFIREVSRDADGKYTYALSDGTSWYKEFQLEKVI